MNEQLNVSNHDLKHILLNAVDELYVGDSVPFGRNQWFMCHAIDKASRIFAMSDHNFQVVLKDAGFTRENYYAFVRRNYPNLEPYINEFKDDTSWMKMMAAAAKKQLDVVLRSKKDFLKYLANQL